MLEFYYNFLDDSTGDERIMTNAVISIGPLNSRGRDSNTGDSEIFGATHLGDSEILNDEEILSFYL